MSTANMCPSWMNRPTPHPRNPSELLAYLRRVTARKAELLSDDVMRCADLLCHWHCLDVPLHTDGLSTDIAEAMKRYQELEQYIAMLADNKTGSELPR